MPMLGREIWEAGPRPSLSTQALSIRCLLGSQALRCRERAVPPSCTERQCGIMPRASVQKPRGLFLAWVLCFSGQSLLSYKSGIRRLSLWDHYGQRHVGKCLTTNYQHGKKTLTYMVCPFPWCKYPQPGLFQTINLWEHAVMQYFLHSDTTDINSRTQIIVICSKIIRMYWVLQIHHLLRI